MKRKSLYKNIDSHIQLKIEKLIDNGYEQSALGTIDTENLPFVTKVVPVVFQKKLYILLSDLSEHTKNITRNPVISLYFAAQEDHKTKSNNARLTLQGHLRKLSFSKKEKDFNQILEKHAQVDLGYELWAHFDDFNFYEFHEKRRLYIEGFAKAYEEIKD